MDRVKWDIPRCLADFFHECDQRPRTEKETEWQVNLQAEGERFLQKADSILRNAECSDPKMVAGAFPSNIPTSFLKQDPGCMCTKGDCCMVKEAG